MSNESAPATVPADPPPTIESFAAAPPAIGWYGTPEAQAELVKALANAMAKFEAVQRTATGQIGNRKFRYAPLHQYTKASLPHLSAEGIAPITAVYTSPLSSPTRKLLRCTMQLCGHGARFEFSLDFRPPTSTSTKVDDSQEVKDMVELGKIQTYVVRYAYKTMLCLDGDPDLDEAGEEIEPQPTKNRQPPQPQPAPKPAAKPAQAREGGQKPAEPPKAAAMPTSVPTAELQAVVDRGTAELNGNGAAEPSVEPVEMEHYPDAPEDIVAMDGEALRTAITRAVQVLRHTPTTAQRRCLQVTGKPRSELTRADAEQLLIALRADILEQRESGM